MLQSRYSNLSAEKSPSFKAVSSKSAKVYKPSTVLAMPRLKSASMVPVTCAVRQNLSPTHRLEEYCKRSVETHSLTGLAFSNWRAIPGNFAKMVSNSCCGAKSVLGNLRVSKDNPMLHKGLLLCG